MLSAGIVVMVASVVVGLIALTVTAVTSPAARSAGRRTRTAMGLSSEDEDVLVPERAWEGTAAYQTAVPYEPAEGEAPPYPAEAETPYYPAEAETPYYPGEAETPYYPAEAETPYYPGEAETPYYPAEAPYEPAERDGAYHLTEENSRYEPAEMEPPAYQVESNSILYSADAEDPPRWFLAAAVFSGAGLLLGMLMVMIGSLS